MTGRGLVLCVVIALCSRAAPADHVETGIVWPGWSVTSGEERYQDVKQRFSDYPLTHLFDNDPKTCWVYRPNLRLPYVPKPGPWLAMHPTWPIRLDAIGLINGYAKSERAYRRNDRAVRVRVTLNRNDYGLLPPSATQAEYDAKLADNTLTMQQIRFPRQKVFRLRIDITEVAPGEVHDLCISELALFCDGRRIDVAMPEVVRYTPGDECGCGVQYTAIRRSGQPICTGSGGDLGDYAAWDSTGRYLADFACTKGRAFTLFVVDAATGRELYRRQSSGEVRSIDWAGRTMTLSFDERRRKPITWTAPAAKGGAAASQPERPNFEDWQDTWANGSYQLQDGSRHYLWPWALPRELPQRWAERQGVLGLAAAEVEKRLGPPTGRIANESTGGVLYLYADFSVGFRDGRCNAWAPRAKYYELWFAQPAEK